MGDSKQWKKIKKSLRAHAKANLHRNVGTDSFRRIIALTCPHAKSPIVSKYMKILKYARKKDFDPEELVAFYQKHGGLNGCGDFIKKQSRKPKKPA